MDQDKLPCARFNASFTSEGGEYLTEVDKKKISNDKRWQMYAVDGRVDAHEGSI